MRAILSEKQIARFETNLLKEEALFNFANSYLEKVYGYKHLDRFIPTSQIGKKNLAYKLVKMFNEKYPTRKKELHSQAAMYLMEELINNFVEYRKTLYKASFMTDEQKADYKANKHKNNSKHKSWYRKGSIAYYHKYGKIKNIVSLPANGQATILSPHHIKIQDKEYGDIFVVENLEQYKGLKIVTTKLKRFKNGKFELQLVLSVETCDTVVSKATGYDWNMTNNEILTSSDGNKYKVPDAIIKKLNDIADEVALLDRDIDINIKKMNRDQKIKLIKREKLFRKFVNIRDEYYKQLAILIEQNNDLVVVEELTSKDFRKKKNTANKLNHKLAVLAPYRLFEILEWRLNANGKVLGRVDPSYTSQVEFGTHILEKHDLSEREWLNASGKLIDRDANAAKNILDWYLHPKNHALHWVKDVIVSGNDVVVSVSAVNFKESRYNDSSIEPLQNLVPISSHVKKEASKEAS
jgi:putative transposase